MTQLTANHQNKSNLVVYYEQTQFAENILPTAEFYNIRNLKRVILVIIKSLFFLYLKN